MDDLVHVAKLVVLGIVASLAMGGLAGVVLSLITKPNDKELLEDDRPIDLIGRRW